MRVALISDIHGNLVSLEAVLADIAREQVDQIVCLGDVLGLGPQPREVSARLQATECLCVMGNHDLELLDLGSALAHMAGPSLIATVLREWLEWCSSQLSEADLAYVRSFQPMLEVPLGTDCKIVCFHGSPRSNEELIVTTTPDAELDEMLAGHTAAVMVGGHSHVPMVRRYKDVMIVNPGSVGLPLEQMPFQGLPRCLPWVEYGIVDCVDDDPTIELRRVSVDLDRIKQAALDSGMVRAAFYIDQWTTP